MYFYLTSVVGEDDPGLSQALDACLHFARSWMIEVDEAEVTRDKT